MKKTIFMFVSIFILLLSPLLSQEKKLEVVAEKASIYSEPNERGFIIKTVDKGTILTLRQKEKIRNIWYYVSFYSKERSAAVLGFIQASLVELIAEIPEITKKEEKKSTVVPVSPLKTEERKPTVIPVPPPKTSVLEKIKRRPLLSQENKLIVIAEKANIYSDPNESSFIIKTVEKGAILTLDQKEKIRNIWYYVSFYSKERSATVLGFIQASLVELIAEIPEITKKEEIKSTVIPVSPPKTEEKKPTVIPVSLPKTEEKKPTIIPVLSPKADVPKEIKIRPTFFIGFLAGYAMPLENNYSRGLQYSGSICLRIIKNVSVELSGLSFQSNVEGNPEALSKGRLSVMPIQLSIQARFPISGRFIPYLLGGGGYYLNRINLDKGITEAWDALGFDIEEKVENALGYHYGAGIDLFFTKNIALNANFRYCIAKIKGSWILTDQISGTKTSGDLGDLNLDSLIFGGGLKFCF